MSDLTPAEAMGLINDLMSSDNWDLPLASPFRAAFAEVFDDFVSSAGHRTETAILQGTPILCRVGPQKSSWSAFTIDGWLVLEMGAGGRGNGFIATFYPDSTEQDRRSKNDHYHRARWGLFDCGEFFESLPSEYLDAAKHVHSPVDALSGAVTNTLYWHMQSNTGDADHNETAVQIDDADEFAQRPWNVRSLTAHLNQIDHVVHNPNCALSDLVVSLWVKGSRGV